MLLVVSTVRAGSRLFTTKLAPTTSAWAPASVAGTTVTALAAKTRKADRTAALIATGALIRDLLPTSFTGTLRQIRRGPYRSTASRPVGVPGPSPEIGPRSYCVPPCRGLRMIAAPETGTGSPPTGAVTPNNGL